MLQSPLVLNTQALETSPLWAGHTPSTGLGCGHGFPHTVHRCTVGIFLVPFSSGNNNKIQSPSLADGAGVGMGNRSP